MTATTRRTAAATAVDYWHQAAEVRREWLEVGLATAPADREAAEESVTRIYRTHGRGRPRFAWVDSPRQALPQVTGIPSHKDLHRWLQPTPPPGRPPIAVDIAAGWSRLMATLDESALHPDLDTPKRLRKGDKPWPVLPPQQALEAGVPLRVVLRQGVRDTLRTALMENLALPIRASLGLPAARLPICWYGQQDAYWIAHYDALHRLGLAYHQPRHASRLDDWATLARSSGWWWPADDLCVMVDRETHIDHAD